MASKAVATATEAVAKAGPNYRVGGTKVFMPNHIITMLPPKKIFSPYFATFQVPLRFNKFDLRDYLHNVYSVEVRNVRSWITPQAPRRRYADKSGDPIDTKFVAAFGRGPWYRPQPIKRMMVELVKPFAYPKPPPIPTDKQLGTDDDPRKPWDYDIHRRVKSQEKEAERSQRRRALEKKFDLQSEQRYVPAFRVALARQARELVIGKRKWTNDVELDEKWQDVVKPKEGSKQA
ncbi:mitochondrial ribosomal protein [Ophiostoma piceae UAMH 11346]|uniref:Large ribosomal subunit protein uL23m n=1 Tax=Ophiostoma piceae (strain UAMH 11346) TaxID=1262450 RepID=S3CQ09_OPHP1|nr:mitochondrial ribosomal protein [Ophiostoma piceae UAMH 11346]